jgi:dTDP-glucose 4,6-dehydratase
VSTLVVCGGAGFIGSAFVRHWLAEYPADRVVVYDLLTYAGNLANLDGLEGRYRFELGDISDHGRLVRLFEEERPDWVANFAAESHNSRALVAPDAFFRTNVLGTVALARAAIDAGVGRFHHVSTCEVFGDLPLDGEGAFVEDAPYDPRTPYNASKAGADLAVRALARTFGLPATISVACNNYGPRQFPEKVIPLFCARALQGQPMPLYRSSRNRREWLHVEDHCRAIELILKRGRVGETYNVGSGVELDVEQIADRVIEVLGLGPDAKRYVDDRPGLDRRYLLDSTKIRAELGWSPRIDVLAGLDATIGWYRDNEAWWRPLLERLAVDETDWRTRRVA